MAYETIVKEKYKYKNESFDKLLAHLLTEMTEEQKARIPKELMHKVFKSTDPNINRLSDGQKDYILSVGFGKKIIKFVMDEEKGMTIEQFYAFRDALRKKKGSDVNALAIAENMCFQGEFVLSDRDLYDAVSYAAMVCYSPVFSMAVNTRKAAKRFKQYKRDFAFGVENLVRMMAHYESNKKRIVTEFGLKNMSEWYCLLFFYDGEKKGSHVYQEKFRYSFSCSKQDLRAGMARLKSEGLLTVRGAPRFSQVNASPAGKALVDKILLKYVINY